MRDKPDPKLSRTRPVWALSGFGSSKKVARF